jgi:hypothetical protein
MTMSNNPANGNAAVISQVKTSHTNAEGYAGAVTTYPDGTTDSRQLVRAALQAGTITAAAAAYRLYKLASTEQTSVDVVRDANVAGTYLQNS